MTIRLYTDEATRRKITAVTWNGGHCSASAEATFKAKVAKWQKQTPRAEHEGGDHNNHQPRAFALTLGRRAEAGAGSDSLSATTASAAARSASWKRIDDS